MDRRLKRIAFAGALAACLTGAFASTASASFHLNLIREVHEGGLAGPDYVMLQSYAAGENLVAGKHIVTYDPSGNVFSDYTIPSNVANGANQATILISNGPFAGADFVAGSGTGPGNLSIFDTGGTVCYTDSPTTVSLDCVAYVGSNASTMFPASPPASPYGTPVSLGGKDLSNTSLVRTTGRGCPTLLEAVDDTNNSAADFSVGA